MVNHNNYKVITVLLQWDARDLNISPRVCPDVTISLHISYFPPQSPSSCTHASLHCSPSLYSYQHSKM